MMNPYFGQHEKMGNAVRTLMFPGAPFETRLTYAMHEFFLAFHHSTPSGPALTYYLKITQIMGEGKVEERAKALTEGERHDVVEALWQLDRAVCRDYYTWEAADDRRHLHS